MVEKHLEEQCEMYFAAVDAGISLGYFLPREPDRHLRLNVDNPAISPLINFYNAHAERIEKLAGEIGVFLIKEEPWHHPEDPYEWVNAFAVKYGESELPEQANHDVGLTTLVAEADRAVFLSKHFPRLLAFKTNVYSMYVEGYEEHLDQTKTT